MDEAAGVSTDEPEEHAAVVLAVDEVADELTVGDGVGVAVDEEANALEIIFEMPLC